MSFELPKRDAEPVRGEYSADSLQDILYNPLFLDLKDIQGVKQPTIDEFLQLFDRLDFCGLDEDRMRTAIETGEQQSLQEVRDSYFQKQRRKLELSTRVTVADEASPTGTTTHSVDSDEKKRFSELLEHTSSTGIHVQRVHALIPAKETVENVIITRIDEDIISAVRLLKTFLHNNGTMDRNTNIRTILYSHRAPLQFELRALMSKLDKMNGVFKSALDDPYEFVKTEGIARDQDLVDRLEAALEEILLSANAELFAEIASERALKKRAKKLGASAIQEAPKPAPKLPQIPKITLPRSQHEQAEELPDPIVEPIGERRVHSLLTDGTDHDAEVTKLTYMENEVLIVHAYDKHLASDSEKCRNKYERVNGKTHLYDLAVQNVAKIIASGVPVEQLAAHGVSFINRNPRSAAYANVNLGYKKVMSANSSTVYFAISDSSQLFEGDLADQKIPCLVVLAETDKGLQVSALKRIRGVSSAALRRKGSNVR